MNNILTLILFTVIISSLAVPVFADSFNEKYSDCTVLDGFVTNLDDSVGLAKECLNGIHNPPTIPDAGELTLLEITEYCLQFNADPTLEKNCINDYDTYGEIDFKSTLITITCVFFIGGATTMLFTLCFDDMFDTKKFRILVAVLGFAAFLIAIAMILFRTEIVASRFPPLV